jgi:N-acetylglutamate synthase-like GNAT family acetyltransferase
MSPNLHKRLQNNSDKMKIEMVKKCTTDDFRQIFEIINDAASAYTGIIPSDCWHEPYMTEQELQSQMDEGVEFWSYTDDGVIMGVMGIQDRGEVTLIRHAYVRTAVRKKGIGSKLLAHLVNLTSKPVLIGTWAAATWAIEFYQKHGFRLLQEEEKNRLLLRYWSIPQRQVETSVVLANADWEVRKPKTIDDKRY